MGKKIPDGKKILYVYVDETNYNYVENLAAETNQSNSYVVDQILEATLKGEEIVLEERVPAYVKKAEEFKKRRKA